MVTRPRRILGSRPDRSLPSLIAETVAAGWQKRWLGPLVLTATITVFHFSIDPASMFWHDLLRRAFYLPIIWAVYQSGLRGGAIASLGVGAIFTVHLVTGWGYHLGSQMDQVYDIIGYLAVGFGVGLVVDRARAVAVAVAQREWDVSLRGVIGAAIHQLKLPRVEVRKLSEDIAEHSQPGMWEYSAGVRLARASDQIDDLTRDLAGIAKILSSRSLTTKPFEWALKFANDPHLGGRFGLMVASTGTDNPPPAIWPISPAILDEVTRCLLEDLQAGAPITGTMDLVVSQTKGELVIECWAAADESPREESKRDAPSSSTRGWVRMKLLELTWSRYNGTVQQCDDGRRRGVRLTLSKPKIGLSPSLSPRPKYAPARRIQESSRAVVAEGYWPAVAHHS